MKQFEATVYGRVQGVSFRHYSRIEAVRLGVTGWAKNERGGTVTVVAQGNNAELEQFIRFLRSGPPLARVERVEINWVELNQSFESFSIRWL